MVDLLTQIVNVIQVPLIQMFGSSELLGWIVIIFLLVELFIFKADYKIMIFVMGIMITGLTIDGIVSLLPAVILAGITAIIIYFRFKEINQ